MGKHKDKGKDHLDKGKAVKEENVTAPSEGSPPSCQHGEGSSSTASSSSSDTKYSYFTYMCFDPNGNWRVLTVPFLSHENSPFFSYGVQVGVNDFLLISTAHDVSLRACQQKKKGRSSSHDDTSSAESSTARNSTDNPNESSDNYRNPMPNDHEASCSGTSPTTSNELGADDPSEAVIDPSKAEKRARKNAKKKARKKEKLRNEKLLMRALAGSADREVASEECAPESSASETCTETNGVNQDEPASGETTPVEQLSDFPINEAQTKDEKVPIMEGMEENHDEELNCCDDVSVMMASTPADHETTNAEAGHAVNSSNSGSMSVEPSREIFHTGKKDLSHDQNSPRRDKKAKRLLPHSGQKREDNSHSIWRKIQRDSASGLEDNSESKSGDCRGLNPVEEVLEVGSPISEDKKQIIEKSVPMEDDRVECLSPKNNFTSENSSHNPSMLLMPKKCESICEEAHYFGADSIKILQALNDTYRTKQLSEALQLATGCPIAEFEKLINAASPVIRLRKEIKICSGSSHEINQPLRKCEIPNIALARIWKWYEEHGSYGLEVRSEDFCYTRRTGFHHLSFRAYFVPSLSAIQLFRMNKGNAAAGKDNRIIPDSDTSSPFDQTANDPKLIFEYLESDKPQSRRPLYEKIKELIREGEFSQNKMYGDPRNLVSMELNELHPRSWYSVAWYPIYRIPGGEHRASFLTFHSFSHLVRESSTLGSKGVKSCVVSPVVGLQSYHAQRWFHLKQFGGGNPSEVLRARVRALERAASVFARGEVSKGGVKSVSRHPDHEFFLSRR